jgi:hypothetical protein
MYSGFQFKISNLRLKARDCFCEPNSELERRAKRPIDLAQVIMMSNRRGQSLRRSNPPSVSSPHQSEILNLKS